jgi:hypothetical protein
MLFKYQVNHYHCFKYEQQLSIVIIVIIVYKSYFICVTNTTDY